MHSGRISITSSARARTLLRPDFGASAALDASGCLADDERLNDAVHSPHQVR